MINNIVYCTNSKHIHFLGASIYSLLINNIHIEFNINIIYSKLSSNDILYLKNILNQFDSKIFFNKIDEQMFSDFPITNKIYSKETYYRLLIPEIIKTDFVLYLDVDTLILNNLSKLLSTNIDNHCLAAVNDFGFHNHLDFIIPDKSNYYFNTGVMLLNLKIWRSENLSYKIYNFIKTYPSIIKYVDQCSINAIIPYNYLKLDAIYNFQLGSLKNKIINNLSKNYIIHFTTSKNLIYFMDFNSVAQKHFFNYLKNTKYPKFNQLYLKHFWYKSFLFLPKMFYKFLIKFNIFI